VTLLCPDVKDVVLRRYSEAFLLIVLDNSKDVVELKVVKPRKGQYLSDGNVTVGSNLHAGALCAVTEDSLSLTR